MKRTIGLAIAATVALAATGAHASTILIDFGFNELETIDDTHTWNNVSTRRTAGFGSLDALSGDGNLLDSKGNDTGYTFRGAAKRNVGIGGDAVDFDSEAALPSNPTGTVLPATAFADSVFAGKNADASYVVTLGNLDADWGYDLTFLSAIDKGRQNGDAVWTITKGSGDTTTVTNDIGRASSAGFVQLLGVRPTAKGVIEITLASADGKTNARWNTLEITAVPQADAEVRAQTQPAKPAQEAEPAQMAEAKVVPNPEAVSADDERAPIRKVIADSAADPHITHYDGIYYIYPTRGWKGTVFKAYSSKDLIEWKDEGPIFDFTTDSQWAKDLAWAPCMATKNGKYYFYYSADKKIGVAVSDSPTGPFVDPLGKPMFGFKDIKSQTIDPMVFIDDDGTAYMYAGSGRCNIVKLNDDMISWDPSTRKVLSLKNYSEGAFMFKRKGKYYLMWSYHSTRDPRYCVNYAIGDSPMGPFEYVEDSPILSQEGVVKGPGHHSVIQVPGTDEWYIVYHRFGLPGGSQHRETCISPMRFNPDGTIQKVDVFEAVKPQG